jgi:tRNA A-37 threonylcarbamoyl transferase component Bud32
VQSQAGSQTAQKKCPVCGRTFEAASTHCPDDSVLLIFDDPLLGTTFDGKCEVLSMVGQGGMSVVYKAKQVGLDRIVALKLMKSHLVDDPNNLKRFQREAQAASLLLHPSINCIYSFGISENGEPYLLLEFLEGTSLARVLENEKPLTVLRACDIFAQVADALAHAHAQGVVHRDLKPSNIMLVKDHDGKDIPKVVDFGTAKLLESQDKKVQQLTQLGEVLGTVTYMSPEQKMGLSVDARTDIYALGYMLFEACHQKMRMPAALEKVVSKALKANPAERYQSAADFRQDLLNVAAGDIGSTMADVKLITPSATKPAKSLQPVLLVATTLATLVFGGLLWNFISEEEKLQLNLQIQKLTGAPRLAILDTQNQLALEKSRNGDHVTAQAMYEDLVPEAEQLPASNYRVKADILFDAGIVACRASHLSDAVEFAYQLNDRADHLLEKDTEAANYYRFRADELRREMDLKRAEVNVSLNESLIRETTLSAVRQAQQLIARGKLTEAEKPLRAIRATLGDRFIYSPAFTDLVDTQLAIYGEQGKYKEGIDYLTDLIRQRKDSRYKYDPHTGWLLIEMGSFLSSNKENDRAIKFVDEGMSLLRKDRFSKTIRVYAELQKATMFACQKKYDEAEAHAKKTMATANLGNREMESMNIVGKSLLAQIALEKHEFAKADKLLTEVYRIVYERNPDQLAMEDFNLLKNRALNVRKGLAEHGFLAGETEQIVNKLVEHGVRTYELPKNQNKPKQ